ncbi:MAG: hypothetical protein UV58_C0004G0041 [Candidatus Wolfebacteria bacterium GW2011_GWC1_43_10]|uniref:NYN domain-containing protein n=2 Tax=Candidatus Wolfeibacteriota TaxID=1752735 RepID=A0A0G1F7P2_9BACT|nr:MAG: hypothetical protein UV58_C0004G0041 [Candidatus Wolfebacteria bacterium GW2011_GWC1_43_10]KKT22766.1 MAG: hypothetical protein UW08_C0003G0002 [Parcubacteria group bacterium GW2011_GWB1_43_8b]OGM90229.1 MAG: hypothetical protein A2108_02445 [Candidatus Wolfebacteria bacterium GWA1_42_9]
MEKRSWRAYNFHVDLNELKLQSLGIDQDKFGKICAFVDFGNVNYWYEYDERDGEENILDEGSKLVIDIEKLANFVGLFSTHRRFYFGVGLHNEKANVITYKARRFFDKVVTKPIQYIKHYFDMNEEINTTRVIKEDVRGKHIIIPKCNFDVEICLDAVRLINEYDTFALFSSDSDFASLAHFVRERKKKFILFSAGYVSRDLKRRASLNINSQQIKKSITFIKQKPRQ